MTAAAPSGTGCRRGHVPTRSPAVHPELGIVPSRTNAWFGVAMWIVVGGVLVWLAPTSWVLAYLAATGVLALGVVIAQLALGHRGRCLARRSWRWTFGLFGQLVDPVDRD